MTSSPSQYLAVALSGADTTFALAYSDPDQKRVIKKHILQFLQEYPSFLLSSDSFTHDHGATVRLLNVSGGLYVSNSAPSIDLMIWVHEDYPYIGPMVFVVSENAINKNHPFVKPSGSVISPYIRTWEYPGCNLTDLVRNLVNIFSRDHPFSTMLVPCKLTHPLLVSKREAMDRLVGSLFSDAVALSDDVQTELHQLGALQDELLNRSDIATSMVISLEHERLDLKKAVSDMLTDADMMLNWLNHPPEFRLPETLNDMAEKAFEAADKESELVMENIAADRALEDAIAALEKAVKRGVLSSEIYIKQVRTLAREQFYHKYVLNKIERDATRED